MAKWFTFDSREFTTYGKYFESNACDVSLVALLNIQNENLKQFTKDLLDPTQQSEEIKTAISDISRGVRAFIQFADIQEVTLDKNSSPLVNRHYAYYESLVYLRESVASWLDGNVLAALTLLRPFIELSIMHLYWYVQCANTGYDSYYKWLKEGTGSPSFGKAIYQLTAKIPAKEFIKARNLKEHSETLRRGYKSLGTYHHTHQPEESVATKSGGFGTISLENFLYYYHSLDIILRQITFLYMLAYPMSIFPVDRITKFGFSGPVGLFFDNMNYSILESYMGSDNLSTLKNSLSKSPQVTRLIEWLEGLPVLSGKDIDSSWDEFVKKNPNLAKTEYNDSRMRIAISKSYERSLGWALNYIEIDNNVSQEELPDEAADKIKSRIRTW